MAVKYEEELEKYSEDAKPEDVEKITSKISKMRRGAIKDIWDIVMALLRMIKDPKGAWPQKALAIGALVYLITPFDAVADVIPVLGLLDDAGVLTAAVSAIGSVLKKYMETPE